MTAGPMEDPRFVAVVDMLGRTGARDFRIGYTPAEDGTPVVWYATASWKQPVEAGKLGLPRTVHEAAAAMDPLAAVFRLAEAVIDGGVCTHCGRPTIFDPTAEPGVLEAMGCVYAWDPELATFRRGCEGDQR